MNSGTVADTLSNGTRKIGPKNVNLVFDFGAPYGSSLRKEKFDDLIFSMFTHLL